MKDEAIASDPFEVEFTETENAEDPARVSLAAHYGARIDQQDRLAVSRIGGQLAERLAGRLKAYCGQAVYATLALSAPRPTPADAYVAVRKFRLGTFAEPVVLIVPLSAIDAVVAVLFGGSADDDVRGRVRLNPLDHHVLERLTSEYEAALAGVVSQHTRLACQRLDGGDDAVPGTWCKTDSDDLVIAFARDSSDVAAGEDPVRLLLPKQLASLLTEPDSSGQATGPVLWSRRLREAVFEIELPVRCIVAEPEIALGRLLCLSADDTLPLDQSGAVRVDVAGTPLASGQPGEQDFRRAVRIDAYLHEGRSPTAFQGDSR